MGRLIDSIDDRDLVEDLVAKAEKGMEDEPAGNDAKAYRDQEEEDQNDDFTAIADELLRSQKEESPIDDVEIFQDCRDEADKGLCQKIDQEDQDGNCDRKGQQDDKTGDKVFFHEVRSVFALWPDTLIIL